MNLEDERGIFFIRVIMLTPVDAKMAPLDPNYDCFNDLEMCS